MATPDPTRRRVRDERGVALPSPVVILSIVAIAMAAIAYLATQGGAPPTEREVAIVARDTTTPPADGPRGSKPTATPSPKVTQKPRPDPVKRGEIFVTVFNNSGITGLAGQVGTTVAQAGWQIAGTDNWYGSVPSTTVYYPGDLARAGKQLALDLGVERTMPAVGSMRRDGLTVILTAPLG